RGLVHPEELRALAWCPGSKVLAGAGEEGSLFFWDRESGRLLRRLDGLVPVTPYGSAVGDCIPLVWGQDGKTVFVGGEGPVRRYDAVSGKAVSPAPPAQRVVSMAWSPDGKTLALGYPLGAVSLWQDGGERV